MAGYGVAHLDEIDELADGRCLYRPIRHHFGITSFGATVWTAHAAGSVIVDEHDEGDPTADEELFLVLRGRAVFDVDGERVDAPAGTLVFTPPRMRRRASAEEAGTMILLIEGSPGQAYRPRGWELWAPLVPLYEAGEYAQVAARLRAAVETHPLYAMLFYNLACCESLTGQPSEALDHLACAIGMSAEFCDDARVDSDLDPIRDHPVFGQLVGE
jgi:mannose-6-phosphate isomerase-like protein (cupin superfamily)